MAALHLLNRLFAIAYQGQLEAHRYLWPYVEDYVPFPPPAASELVYLSLRAAGAALPLHIPHIFYGRAKSEFDWKCALPSRLADPAYASLYPPLDPPPAQTDLQRGRLVVSLEYTGSGSGAESPGFRWTVARPSRDVRQKLSSQTVSEPDYSKRASSAPSLQLGVPLIHVTAGYYFHTGGTHSHSTFGYSGHLGGPGGGNSVRSLVWKAVRSATLQAPAAVTSLKVSITKASTSGHSQEQPICRSAPSIFSPAV